MTKKKHLKREIKRLEEVNAKLILKESEMLGDLLTTFGKHIENYGIVEVEGELNANRDTGSAFYIHTIRLTRHLKC